MENTTLRKLQLIEKEILSNLIEVCKQNDITYYVIGGTLLGAVRHGGFIPWDDDIDLAIPRKDYKKLIQVMHELGDSHPVLGMEYYRDKPSLYYYPIRITNKNYKIAEPRTKEGYAHPWIDILPLDGYPNNEKEAKAFVRKMKLYKTLLGFHYVDNLRDIKRSFKEKVAIRFGKITKIGRLIDPTKVKNKIDALLESHDINDCNIVGTCMGAYFLKEFVPKEHFGNGSTVVFEGMEVNAPEMVHEYLTHMYGDYMQLPPKEKQVSHGVTFIE